MQENLLIINLMDEEFSNAQMETCMKDSFFTACVTDKERAIKQTSLAKKRLIYPQRPGKKVFHPFGMLAKLTFLL